MVKNGYSLAGYEELLGKSARLQPVTATDYYYRVSVVNIFTYLQHGTILSKVKSLLIETEMC